MPAAHAPPLITLSTVDVAIQNLRSRERERERSRLTRSVGIGAASLWFTGANRTGAIGVGAAKIAARSLSI